MANKNSKNEIRFVLTDDDFRAFGRYRILYTKEGRKMVMRQRLTYLISGVMIAFLFTVFHLDPGFTKLAYVISAVVGIGGFIMGEKLLLRQQDNAIRATESTIERVHPEENIVTLGDETFETYTGSDTQTFTYKDIQKLDLTEEGIYVWVSDTAIMPLPAHAFRGMPEMKETYKWIKGKIKEQGGSTDED